MHFSLSLSLLRDSREQLPAAHLIDILVVVAFIHIKGQLLLFFKDIIACPSGRCITAVLFYFF